MKEQISTNRSDNGRKKNKKRYIKNGRKNILPKFQTYSLKTILLRVSAAFKKGISRQMRLKFGWRHININSRLTIHRRSHVHITPFCYLEFIIVHINCVPSSCPGIITVDRTAAISVHDALLIILRAEACRLNRLHNFQYWIIAFSEGAYRYIRRNFNYLLFPAEFLYVWERLAKRNGWNSHYCLKCLHPCISSISYPLIIVRKRRWGQRKRNDGSMVSRSKKGRSNHNNSDFNLKFVENIDLL